MAQQNFNVSLPNDGLGDELRSAFIKQQDMNTELYNTKVDKVTGKDLSSNDYTNLEKSKLAGIENGAQKNVPILYDDIIGIPELNSIAAYPDTKFNYIDSNDFTIPENVQALSVRKNGDPTDNKLDWVQLGNVISYIGTLTVPDYLIISGVYVIPSGGGGTGELITKFTSNPIPTIVGTNILVPSDETWLIDSVPYTNPTVSTIPFSYAPDGLLYFLTVVATKLNTFVGKVGTASLNPSEPIVNNDELFLTTYLISDGTATVIIPPVNSNIFVEKEIYQPQITIGSAPVGAIAMGKKSALVVAGTIPSIEFIIKNNTNDYFIGQPFQTTNKTPNLVKFTHLSSDVAGNPNSISWYNPELTDYYATPNEVTLWILDIIDGQKVYRRATTYIDTDNVVFRDGTKVGKLITGDLEFAETIGISTEEISGMRSRIFNDSGKWYIGIVGVGINLEFQFNPNKGLISNTLFDKESDNLAFAQMGDVLPLADRIFDLELANTGDNAPNTNSNAYADSKVSDAIVDGVTAVAPSQNAVFDALTLKANSASPTFTGSVVVPDATADNQAVSLGQLLRPQIEVSGNQTAVTGWNGKEITFITNGLLTVQGTLPEQFNFALRADNSTITWAITAPFTWRVDGLTVGTAPSTMSSGQIAYVSRRLNTNEIRVSGL